MTLTREERSTTSRPTVDPVRWPGLADVRHAPVHAAVARALFHRVVRTLPVRAELPDGRTIGGGGPDSPRMRIVRDDAFFARVGVGGLIGFGEAYMAGDWEADDPAVVLAPFAARMGSLVPKKLQSLRGWYTARHPADEENTPEGARSNISRHYDLSNDLFALFLDTSMTYSSGLWEDGDSLTDAQLRKIDRLLDIAGVREGSRLLEIGTGWGALAIRAARRGATVTTLTISAEQKRLAEERVSAAGLEDCVEVLLRDYRDAEGTYDAVVSVEMVEAVGERYWPAYVQVIDRVLAPGGRAAVQAIVMPHERMVATRNTYTWIHKYVFPGGQIPSVRGLEQALSEHTSLHVRERFVMGRHYATTLRRWRERFLTRRADVLALGFDETFLRTWEFYLAYCEAGFRAGYLDVEQLVLSREQM